jgi:hypothetical protein
MPNWMVVNGHQQFKIIEALETKSKSGICDMLMGISDSVVKKTERTIMKRMLCAATRFFGKDLKQKRGQMIFFLELEGKRFWKRKS